MASASLSGSSSSFICNHTPNPANSRRIDHFHSFTSEQHASSLPVHSFLLFSRSRSIWRQRRQSSWELYQKRDASSVKKVTLESIAESLKSGSCKKILVVAGAGVSCSAGIPDFRTPGSGLYDNLHKFNLPYPEAIFDLDFYRQDPKPFVTLAKEIWPGVKYRPTLTHSFFSLLDKKGALKRIYTQNIDGLEAVADVNPDKLVECHGHFRSASCIECRAPHDSESCKSTILEEGKAPTCNICGGVVKPDIVFFGEELPNRFSNLVHDDIRSSDLLMVLGTSLLVAPVALIPEWAPNSMPRVLINRERVGDFRPGKLNDVFMEGDSDDNVRKLCQLVGWETELDQIYQEVHSKPADTSN